MTGETFFGDKPGCAGPEGGVDGMEGGKPSGDIAVTAAPDVACSCCALLGGIVWGSLVACSACAWV